MKSGISLVEMAKEIQRQAELKADYVMDTRSLRLEPFGSDLYLNAYTPSGEMAVEPLEINAIAHRQIGTHLKIPAAYYDKMLTQHPQLLSENVNAWFEREPAVRLVRTIGGTARAFLSNRYRRIDNLDIAGIVLPVLQDTLGSNDLFRRPLNGYLTVQQSDHLVRIGQRLVDIVEYHYNGDPFLFIQPLHQAQNLHLIADIQKSSGLVQE